MVLGGEVILSNKTTALHGAISHCKKRRNLAKIALKNYRKAARVA